MCGHTFSTVSQSAAAVVARCCCPQVEVGVQLQTKPGQHVVLVGSHPSMGSWSLDGALPMTWTDGHVWKASIELPADSMDLEYKVRLKAVQAAVATQQGSAQTWTYTLA
jgi:hypothetical protein